MKTGVVPIGSNAGGIKRLLNMMRLVSLWI